MGRFIEMIKTLGYHIKARALRFVAEYQGIMSSVDDIVRISMFVAIASIMFYPDWSMLRINQYVLGMSVSLALISHLVRKLLFPYIDLKQFVNKSLENPMAAAIVAAAIIYLLSVFVQVTGSMFGVPSLTR